VAGRQDAIARYETILDGNAGCTEALQQLALLCAAKGICRYLEHVSLLQKHVLTQGVSARAMACGAVSTRWRVADLSYRPARTRGDTQQPPAPPVSFCCACTSQCAAAGNADAQLVALRPTEPASHCPSQRRHGASRSFFEVSCLHSKCGLLDAGIRPTPRVSGVGLVVQGLFANQSAKPELALLQCRICWPYQRHNV
jgi:hypothetical protein